MNEDQLVTEDEAVASLHSSWVTDGVKMGDPAFRDALMATARAVRVIDEDPLPPPLLEGHTCPGET